MGLTAGSVVNRACSNGVTANYNGGNNGYLQGEIMPELIEEPIVLNMEKMAEQLDPSEPRDPDMFHVSTLVNEAAR